MDPDDFELAAEFLDSPGTYLIAPRLSRRGFSIPTYTVGGNTLVLGFGVPVPTREGFPWGYNVEPDR